MSQEPDTTPEIDGFGEEAEQTLRELGRQVDRARRLLQEYRELIGEQADNDSR